MTKQSRHIDFGATVSDIGAAGGARCLTHPSRLAHLLAWAELAPKMWLQQACKLQQIWQRQHFLICLGTATCQELGLSAIDCAGQAELTWCSKLAGTKGKPHTVPSIAASDMSNTSCLQLLLMPQLNSKCTRSKHAQLMLCSNIQQGVQQLAVSK